MAPNQILARSMLQGGIHENGTKGSGPYLNVGFNGLNIDNTALRALRGAVIFSNSVTGPLEIGQDTEALTSFNIRGSDYAGHSYYVAGSFRARTYRDGSALTTSDNVKISWHIANVEQAAVEATGITLPSGKDIRVAGSKVIGARGAAVADAASANATDLATAITLVNELKAQVNTLLARLRAATGHGLIA